MSEVFKSEYTVQTILGVINQMYAATRIPYVANRSTTLNTFYNVLPNEDPSSIPIPRYFCFGTGGSYNLDDGYRSRAHYPSADRGRLYNDIPFRVVPVDEDLTPAERAEYRMRRRVTIAGSDYWEYRFKKVRYGSSYEAAVAAIAVSRVTAGNQTSVFDLSNIDFTGTPTKLTTPDVANSGVDTIRVTTDVVCRITGIEGQEYINLYHGGDPSYLRINEMGLVSGEDVSVTIEGVTYTEAKYAQLYAHRCSTGFEMNNAEEYEDQIFRLENGNILPLL